MGKTETIKERSIYVYLPSLEHKKRWEVLSEKQKSSISKFVIEHVENSLRQIEDPNYKSNAEVWKDYLLLKEELEKVTREKHVLETALERLEEELRRYRAQSFLESNFMGVRSYQKELIDILRSGRIISSDEITSRLGIKNTEHEAIKAISKQLENLESYGLVVSSPKGWKWTQT